MEFIKEYWTNVFEPFLDLYKTGNTTPNPDVLCNKYIKFHYLKEYINKKLGITYMATGHYANISHHRLFHDQISLSSEEDSVCNSYSNNEPLFPVLRSGLDVTKDQSYFLSLTPVCIWLYVCLYV